jgi:hypothetical protein
MSKQLAPEANQPVHTVRHRNIKASIWRNETDKGPMYKVVVTRSYQENNEWHDTHSFGYDDLMNVAKLMYDAHSVISALRAKEAAARTTVRSPAPPPAQPAPRGRGPSPAHHRKEGA